MLNHLVNRVGSIRSCIVDVTCTKTDGQYPIVSAVVVRQSSAVHDVQLMGGRAECGHLHVQRLQTERGRTLA